MKWVMMALFLVILQFYAHQNVLNMELQEQDYQRISDAVKVAAQDASMDVTQNSASSGEPVFDSSLAIQTFDASLAANLNLNPTTLQPNARTMLAVAPKVLDAQFYDWSNATFPYNYVNPTYNLNQTMNNPSVVFVVQCTIPSYAAGTAPFTVTIPVVQSYQFSGE